MMSRKLKIVPKQRIGQEKKINRDPPIKTVSIFIKNLDSHLAESYQKLKKSKISDISTRKHSVQICESWKEDESTIKESRSTLDNYPKLKFTSEKKERSEFGSQLQISKCEEKIALIDNGVVNEYVNLVYDMYNIPDPMKDQQREMKKNDAKMLSTHARTHTASSSLRKKSSASDLKEKIVLHRDIDLTPFNAPLSNRKDDSDIDISLIHDRSRQKLTLHKSTILKKRKNSDAMEQTKKINLKTISKCTSQTGNYTPVTPTLPFTPQSYRYCFACEQAVLEANLKYHQNQCHLLRESFSKPIEDIVNMLDSKIARLSTQIKREFVEVQNDSFLNEYRDLKRSVGEWINDVKSIGDKENRCCNSARKRMSVIQDKWDQALGGRFEAMARLHWFSRIRENMRNNYGL